MAISNIFEIMQRTIAECQRKLPRLRKTLLADGPRLASEHPHDLLTQVFCTLSLSTERPLVYSGFVCPGVIHLTLLPPGRTNHTSYLRQKHLSLAQAEFSHLTPERHSGATTVAP